MVTLPPSDFIPNKILIKGLSGVIVIVLVIEKKHVFGVCELTGGNKTFDDEAIK
jgi:hypothetical protein